VAIITGSTGGIGYSVAERLGKEGCTVIVSSRDIKKVEKAVEQLKKEGIKAFGTKCDAGKDIDNKKLIEFTIETCGRLDYVVINAGANVPEFSKFLETKDTVWNDLLTVNLKGPYYVCKYALPYLRSNKINVNKCVVMITSVAGYEPNLNNAIYGMTKAAQLYMTRALAQEMALDNIRVNSVAPGLLRTTMTEIWFQNPKSSEGYKQTTLLQRLGTVEDVSGVVAFLCSNDAKYITGGKRSRLKKKNNIFIFKILV